MRVVCAICLLVVWCLGRLASCSFCGSFSQPWRPKWSDKDRSDLRCYTIGCEDKQELDSCCPCLSCLTWEGNERDLYIEYISVLGKSLVISNQAFNGSDVYRVEHKHSLMTEIPNNLCNWDKEHNVSELFASTFQTIDGFLGNIVELDFSYNKILKIPDINCLERLDKLYLNSNSISHVSNSSFTRLYRLRYIQLADNEITSLDLNVLSAPQLSLFKVDFTKNALEKLDVSNMFSLQPFCMIDFDENKIETFVNENFTFDIDKTNGSGFVSFKNNQITEFPNIKDLLHFDSWEQMGKLIKYGFDFRDNPLKCDCNIQPFLAQAQHIGNAFWQDYMNIICAGPPNMKGQSLININQSELVCNMPECKIQQCTCVDKPYQDTLYVTCSGLDKLPDIPVSSLSKYVSLNVSGNNIKEITNVSYLSRLTSLDISNNDLIQISDDVTKALENCTFLNISDNPKIRTLPQMFQYRDVCNTRMHNLEIDCNCNTSWIETWLNGIGCSDNLFKCNIPEIGVTSASNFHASDLECYPDMPILIIASVVGIVTLLMIIGGLCVYTYRYELLILYLRLRRRKGNVVLPNYKYDVFVSFNENEEHATEWVTKSLNPNLMESGYATFLPLRNLDYGAERNSDVIRAIENSCNFLIIVSEGYLQEADEGMRSWTENEWKFGWNNFKTDRGKNIVLVNYDHMEPSEVVHPVIRAYLRVGCTVNFENHDRNIMDDIETKLGKPIRLHNIDTQVNDNMNKKPSPFNLFVTSPYDDDESDLEFELEEKINNEGHSTENMHQMANFRLQHKPKVCKYRKCYACKQKELAEMERKNPTFEKSRQKHSETLF